jgi:lambda family phage portal protein
VRSVKDWFSRTSLAAWLRQRAELRRSRSIRADIARARSRVRVNLLERGLAFILPTVAARRQAARVELRRAEITLAHSERLLGYKEGRQGPMAPRIEASGASADLALELGFDRRNEVDRARALERNNPLARLLLDRSTQSVVGEGLALKCKTKDEGWNKAAEAIWEDFVANCDARGRSTLHELMALHHRGRMRDGDSGFVLRADGKLRPFESDELASPHGGYMTPSDTDGVELDRDGKIIAYHIFDYDPTIIWPDRRRAIPRLSRIGAEDVLFQARRDRLNQTRGISGFNGIHELLEQAADSFEAVAVAHQMAASFGLWFKKKAPIGFGYGQNASPDNRPDVEFEPGMQVRLDPDEEVGQINPTHPSGSFEILITNLMRISSSIFGLVLDFVTFDFTKANYSNLRAASIESALVTRIEQHRYVREAYRTLYFWRLARAIRMRELTPRRDCNLHAWGVPGKPWADPEVELRAAMASIDAGLDTRRAILARRGMDFDEVITELARENKAMRKLDLPDVRSIITRDALEMQEKPGSNGGNGAEKNGATGRHRLLS